MTIHSSSAMSFVGKKSPIATSYKSVTHPTLSWWVFLTVEYFAFFFFRFTFLFVDTSLLNYRLPEDRIAQTPAEPRGSAKLLVYHRATGAREHLHVRDLSQFFSSHDMLVVNTASVRRARLHGMLRRASSRREVFL